MAQLKTERMNDDTAISSVDDGLGLAETAVGTILGIPMDFEIAGSVFQSIDSSGRITGRPRIFNESGSEAAAAGIEFIDDLADIGVRLVPIGGGLMVYKRDPASATVGTLIQDLAEERKLVNLDDVDPTVLDADGKILGTLSGQVVAIEPSSGGAVAYIDLTDVADANYLGKEDYVPTVVETGGGAGYLQLQPVPGSTGVNTFIELLDTLAGPLSDSEFARLVISRTGGTYFVGASDHWHARAQYQSNQTVPTGVQFKYIWFGTVNSEYPASSNLIVNESQGSYTSSLITLPRDVYSDAIYNIEYTIRLTYQTTQSASVMVAISSNSVGGISCASHRAVHRGIGGTEPSPGETMSGSFIARVPYGSTGNGSVRFQFGRVNTAALSWTTTGIDATIEDAQVSVTRIV
jgi:hypothetical protein